MSTKEACNYCIMDDNMHMTLQEMRYTYHQKSLWIYMYQKVSIYPLQDMAIGMKFYVNTCQMITFMIAKIAIYQCGAWRVKMHISSV